MLSWRSSRDSCSVGRGFWQRGLQVWERLFLSHLPVLLSDTSHRLLDACLLCFVFLSGCGGLSRSSCCDWMWEFFIALERDNTPLAARVQHVKPSQPSPAASFLSCFLHLLCARCWERGQEGEGLVIPGTSPWQHLLFFFRFFFLPWASWYYFTVVCLSFQGSPSPISSCAFSTFCPFCTASTSLLVVGSW